MSSRSLAYIGHGGSREARRGRQPRATEWRGSAASACTQNIWSAWISRLFLSHLAPTKHIGWKRAQSTLQSLSTGARPTCGTSPAEGGKMIAEGAFAGREAAQRAGECESSVCPPATQTHGMDCRRTGAAPNGRFCNGLRCHCARRRSWAAAGSVVVAIGCNEPVARAQS